MTAFHPPLSQPALQSRAFRLAPALFAITLFLSALLLFAVQPMFTKMVLPRLGGAPTVWSVAMVFFQAALLAGYVYAHLLIRFLPLGLGALVHLAVLAAAAMTLPISIALGFGAPPTSDIAIWLIGLFAASIGLPFAVAVRQRAVAARLVRGQRPSAIGQSLRSLRGLKPRLVRRADRLSGCHRAVAVAEPSGADVVRRLCRSGDPDRGDRTLHRAPAEPHPGRGSGGTSIDARPPCLGRAVRDSGRPRHRGHVLHDDRCCGRAVSLGGSRSRSIC